MSFLQCKASRPWTPLRIAHGACSLCAAQQNNLARVAPDVASEPSALEALLSDPDFQVGSMYGCGDGKL